MKNGHAAMSPGRIIAIVAVLASVWLNLGLVVNSLADANTKSDLKAEFLMANALAAGVDPYTSLDVLATTWLPGQGVGKLTHPTPHPIFVGWLCLPLAALTFPQAAVAWFVFEVLCLVVGVLLWLRIEGQPLRAWLVILLVIGLIGWFPIAMELGLGQLSILLSALFLGSWLALVRGKDSVAGACLGTMVLIKLVGVPVLLWLALKGRWRVVGSAAALVTGAHLMAIWIHGWSLVLGYYTTIGPLVAQQYITRPTNLSVWSLGVRLFGTEALATALTLALLGVLVWLAARARRWDTSLPFLFGGGLFLSPVAWVHYFVMAVPAMAVLTRRLAASAWPRWPTRAAAAAFVLVSIAEVFYLAWAPFPPMAALATLLGLLLWSDRWVYDS